MGDPPTPSRTLLGHLPPEVAAHLGYYVYLYVDPRTNSPFYVGKGQRGRVLAHLDDVRDSTKTRMIAELHAAHLEPRIDILAHGLPDEETALRIEAAVIDLLGLGQLTNAVRGWKSLEMGRMTLDELIGYYAAEPVTIDHRVLLVRINQLFRHQMLALELYEATRGIWRLGERRGNAEFALAVFEGVVREVYQIQSWHPARTTSYSTRDLAARDVSGRWEFVGAVAPRAIREQYRGRSVKSYLARGLRSPTVYVNA